MYEVWMNEGESSTLAILTMYAFPYLKSRPTVVSRYQTVAEGINRVLSTTMVGMTT